MNERALNEQRARIERIEATILDAQRRLAEVLGELDMSVEECRLTGKYFKLVEPGGGETEYSYTYVRSAIPVDTETSATNDNMYTCVSFNYKPNDRLFASVSVRKSTDRFGVEICRKEFIAGIVQLTHDILNDTESAIRQVENGQARAGGTNE